MPKRGQLGDEGAAGEGVVMCRWQKLERPARRQTGGGAWGAAVEAKGKKGKFGQQFGRIWQERRRGVGQKRQAG